MAPSWCCVCVKVLEGEAPGWLTPLHFQMWVSDGLWGSERCKLWSSLGVSELQGFSSPSHSASCPAGDWNLSLAGGPAEKAGLQQLDTVLQLNEQPVEHWKCVELAHEIR